MLGLQKILGKTEYVAVLGDGDGKADASIVVGGKTEKFVPSIRVSKWDNEAWLKIDHEDTVVSHEVEEFLGGKVELSAGGLIHRYFIDVNEHLEYEVEFPQKPASNKITLKLDFSPSLKFCYQPPLTQQDIDDNCRRPENVVGSYAVYFNKAHNKYKTGKFCHIYRPKVIDDDGKEIWAELSVDEVKKTLTIAIDQAYLDAAKYPVIIDPDFGYKSCGVSQIGTNFGVTGRIIWGELPQPADAGTLTFAYACLEGCDDASHEAIIGLYEAAANGDKHDDTTATSRAEWDATPAFNANESIAVNTGFSILGSTNYYGAVILEDTDATSFIQYDANGGWDIWWTDTGSFSAPATLPGIDAARNDRQLSIYFEYTVAGVGRPLPQRSLRGPFAGPMEGPL